MASIKANKVHLNTEALVNKTDSYRFNIEFYIYEDGGVFMAYCPALDLATSGKTYIDAVTNFYECFQLYVETCLEFGTLHDDLIAHGWKMTAKTVAPPSYTTLMRKPEMKRLMQDGISFQRIVSPAFVPALV